MYFFLFCCKTFSSIYAVNDTTQQVFMSQSDKSKDFMTKVLLDLFHTVH